MIKLNIEADNAAELQKCLGDLAALFQAPGVHATVSTVVVQPGTNLYEPVPQINETVVRQGYLTGDKTSTTPVTEAPQPVQDTPQQTAPSEEPQQTFPPEDVSPHITTDVLKVKAANWMRADKDPKVTKTRMGQLNAVMKKYNLPSMANLTDAMVDDVANDLRALGVGL